MLTCVAKHLVVLMYLSSTHILKTHALCTEEWLEEQRQICQDTLGLPNDPGLNPELCAKLDCYLTCTESYKEECEGQTRFYGEDVMINRVLQRLYCSNSQLHELALLRCSVDFDDGCQPTLNQSISRRAVYYNAEEYDSYFETSCRVHEMMKKCIIVNTTEDCLPDMAGFVHDYMDITNSPGSCGNVQDNPLFDTYGFEPICSTTAVTNNVRHTTLTRRIVLSTTVTPPISSTPTIISSAPTVMTSQPIDLFSVNISWPENYTMVSMLWNQCDLMNWNIVYDCVPRFFDINMQGLIMWCQNVECAVKCYEDGMKICNDAFPFSFSSAMAYVRSYARILCEKPGYFLLALDQCGWEPCLFEFMEAMSYLSSHDIYDDTFYADQYCIYITRLLRNCDPFGPSPGCPAERAQHANRVYKVMVDTCEPDYFQLYPEYANKSSTATECEWNQYQTSRSIVLYPRNSCLVILLTSSCLLFLFTM